MLSVFAASLLVWCVVSSAIRLTWDAQAIVPDNAANLEGASRIVDGGLPYRDVFDPGATHTALYVYAVPVILARLTGLPEIPVFTSGVNLLAIASAFSVVWLLSKHAAVHSVTDLAAASLPLLLLTADSVTPLRLFGEREHLFVLAYAPFFVLRALRASGAGSGVRFFSAITIGAALGLTCTFKPAFGLVVCAVEIGFAVQARRLIMTSELIGAIAAAAGSVFLLLAGPRVEFDEFWSHFVPMVWSGYHTIDVPWPVMMMSALDRGLVPVLAAGLTLVWTAGRRGALAFMVPGAVIAFFAALASFFLQQKGWAYQLGPMRWAVWLNVGIAISGVWAASHVAAKVCAGAGLMVALIAATVLPASTRGSFPTFPKVEETIVRNSRPGDPVAILSNRVEPGYPTLVRINRRSAIRFTWLPVVMLEHMRSTQATEDLETWFVSALREDLATRRPRVVLVEFTKPCEDCGEPPSLAAYVADHRALAELLQPYIRQPDVDHFHVYVRP